MLNIDTHCLNIIDYLSHSCVRNNEANGYIIVRLKIPKADVDWKF